MVFLCLKFNFNEELKCGENTRTAYLEGRCITGASGTPRGFDCTEGCCVCVCIEVCLKEEKLEIDMVRQVAYCGGLVTLSRCFLNVSCECRHIISVRLYMHFGSSLV